MAVATNLVCQAEDVLRVEIGSYPTAINSGTRAAVALQEVHPISERLDEREKPAGVAANRREFVRSNLEQERRTESTKGRGSALEEHRLTPLDIDLHESDRPNPVLVDESIERLQRHVRPQGDDFDVIADERAHALVLDRRRREGESCRSLMIR